MTELRTPHTRAKEIADWAVACCGVDPSKATYLEAGIVEHIRLALEQDREGIAKMFDAEAGKRDGMGQNVSAATLRELVRLVRGLSA